MFGDINGYKKILKLMQKPRWDLQMTKWNKTIACIMQLYNNLPKSD